MLNEPETSLHPDLLPALGRLIATLEQQEECNSLMLEKELGETQVVGADQLDMPVWHWAPR